MPEAALARQMLRGREQHRRVAVVAARVHLAGDPALVRQARGLVDRQCVHVGAQAETLGAAADLQLRDDARAAQPRCTV